MNLFGLKIRVDEGQAFRKEMTRLSQGLSHWGEAPVNGAMAAFVKIEDLHKALYDSGGSGMSSGRWATLRLSTIGSRTARMRCSRFAPRDYAGPVSGGTGVLLWSGRLRSSLTGERLAGTNASDAIRKVRATGLTFGTQTPTAAIHWAGRSGRNPMPIRKPIDDINGAEVGISAIDAKVIAFLRGEEYDFTGRNSLPSR